MRDFVRQFCVFSLFGILLVVTSVDNAHAGKMEKWAQETLNKLGYDAGVADGEMTEKSIAALRKFQTAKSITTTGKVDRASLQALSIAVRCDTKAYKTETKNRLFGAVYCNDLDHLKALIAGGADPKEVTKKDQTPLMAASWMGRTDFVKPLVDAGVNVNHISSTGYTALMFAAAFGKSDTVRALNAAGADRYLPKDSPHTAAALANKGGYDDVVKLVKLEINQEFRSCLAKMSAPILKGLPIKLYWGPETGELHMDYNRPPNDMFTTNGMPRHVLGLIDSVMKRKDAADGLLKTCERTCASYCSAE